MIMQMNNISKLLTSSEGKNAPHQARNAKEPDFRDKYKHIFTMKGVIPVTLRRFFGH